MTASRIAVFASGSGSNLTAILDHFAHPRAADVGSVALVVSNQRTAGALARAAGRDVATALLGDPADAAEMDRLLESHRIDYVALAGYVKMIPRAVVTRMRGRIVNVHPALLPAFGGAGMYGPRVHAAVLASGARVTGATVHFVNDEYDRGEIIMQWPVPVYPTDSAASLGARVLRVEHALYPRVLEALAAGLVHLTAQGVLGTRAHVPPADPTFVIAHPEPEALAAEIDSAVTNAFPFQRGSQ